MATKVNPEEAAKHATPPPKSGNSQPKTLKDIPPEADFEVFGIEPETKTFKSGATVTINQFTVGQIRKMLPHLKALMGPLAEMFQNGELDITRLQAVDGDALVLAIGVATGLTEEQVDALPLEEFIWVVTKVITVNGDFFVRTLPRLAGGAAVALMELAKRHGLDGAGSSPVS